MVALLVISLRSHAALLAYWAMDGDWSDSTGNGYDGTPAGNPTFTAGMAGQAGSFDRAGDYINIGDPVKSVTPFSIALWVKANPFPETADPLDENRYVFSNGGHTGGGIGFSLSLHYDSPGNEARWGFNYRQAGNVWAGVGAIPSTDWTHFVAIWDGETDPILYINGVSKTGFVDTLTTGSPQNLRLGAPSNSTSWLWDGLIDEMGGWGNALSPAEVDELYSTYGGDIGDFEAGGGGGGDSVPEPNTFAMLTAGILITRLLSVRKHA